MRAVGEGAICNYFGSKLTSSQHYPAPTDEETTHAGGARGGAKKGAGK